MKNLLPKLLAELCGAAVNNPTRMARHAGGVYLIVSLLLSTGVLYRNRTS